MRVAIGTPHENDPTLGLTSSWSVLSLQSIWNDLTPYKAKEPESKKERRGNT